MKKKEVKITIKFSQFSESDFNYDNIKYIIDVSLSDVVKNLYYVISIHPIFKALESKFSRSKLKNKLSEPQTIEDYCNNLNIIKEACDNLGLGFAVASKLKSKKINKVSVIRQEYSEILKAVIDFTSSVYELNKIKDFYNTRNYIKQLNSFYSRMLNNLTSMTQVSDYPNLTIETFGEAYKNIFNDLSEHLKLLVEMVNAIVSHEREMKKESEKLKREVAMVEEKSRAIKLPFNDAEQKRLQLIEKANSYYEEFCLDFMRDLEKQVPFSASDMYEEFIGVKFAKFIKTYNMPLSNNVSEGVATEVIYQINLMIDYISKIKQNSYVTSVYEK